eukprot:COSAG06_NODE_267_length_18822_cov_26.254607_2_plen_324_part_00
MGRAGGPDSALTHLLEDPKASASWDITRDVAESGAANLGRPSRTAGEESYLDAPGSCVEGDMGQWEIEQPLIAARTGDEDAQSCRSVLPPSPRPWTVLSSVHDLATAAAGMPVIVVDVMARRVEAIVPAAEQAEGHSSSAVPQQADDNSSAVPAPQQATARTARAAVGKRGGKPTRKSKQVGVSWNSKTQRWVSQTYNNGKIHGRVFADEKSAIQYTRQMRAAVGQPLDTRAPSGAGKRKPVLSRKLGTHEWEHFRSASEAALAVLRSGTTGRLTTSAHIRVGISICCNQSRPSHSSYGWQWKFPDDTEGRDSLEADRTPLRA